MLDGNLEYDAQVTFKKKYFPKKKWKFVTSLQTNALTDEIKWRSLHVCAPISELPSNISTKGLIDNNFNK